MRSTTTRFAPSTSFARSAAIAGRNPSCTKRPRFAAKVDASSFSFGATTPAKYESQTRVTAAMFSSTCAVLRWIVSASGVTSATAIASRLRSSRSWISAICPIGTVLLR